VTLGNPAQAATSLFAADPPVGLIFLTYGLVNVGLPSTGELLLGAKAFASLTRFYNAAQGDPSYASGLLLRMGYLSATTVATLGLGDITPVSAEARLLVSVEAIAASSSWGCS
jgi:hypothetical protein